MHDQTLSSALYKDGTLKHLITMSHLYIPENDARILSFLLLQKRKETLRTREFNPFCGSLCVVACAHTSQQCMKHLLLHYAGGTDTQPTPATPCLFKRTTMPISFVCIFRHHFTVCVPKILKYCGTTYISKMLETTWLTQILQYASIFSVPKGAQCGTIHILSCSNG